MPIVGFFENPLSIGAINTSASASLTQNFAPSTVWSHPTLQTHIETDDESSAESFISNFVDSSGSHSGKFSGIFANGCTSMTYVLKVTDCFARINCTTHFF